MRHIHSIVALTLLVFFTADAFAGGLIVVTKRLGANDAVVEPIPLPRPVPPRIRPPVRPIPRPMPVYRFAPLQTQQHHVKVTIKDQVAITEIDQTFFNPNNARLEGDFIFPLPVGAQIDEFTMDVNGKQQAAELLNADKARKIYTDIVRSQQDPALLEYVGRGMLKCRIFPIEPRKPKRVTLKYTQLLKNDTGLVGYRFPLNTKKYSAGPVQDMSVTVNLSSQQIIKSVYSPSHEVKIDRPAPNQANLTYVAKNVVPDVDYHLYFSTQPKTGADIGVNMMVFNDELTQALKDEGGYFMMLASPGVPGDSTKVVEKDVVFVFDTSGSMAGKKMDQAKKALEFCIANLNDGDRFNIVRFSTEVDSLFDDLVANDKKHRDLADKFVKKLRPIGGTAIEEALVAALEPLKSRKNADRPYVVIFLTDGRPTIGNTNEDDILKAVSRKMGDSSARVFCFGIGTDINTHLLDKVTEKTRAVSQYVLPDEDIEVKVSGFFTKINHPVLSNIALKVKTKEGTEPVRVTRLYPAPLPDIFKGDQLVILGRFEGTGDAEVELTGSVNDEKKTFTYNVKFSDKEIENDFIPRMWATRRVGYLLDQIRLHGESDEVKTEVTRLARQYGIVTPYTAYLIVEDEANRNVAPQARNLRGLAGDRMAMAEAEEVFKTLKEKSGEGAVANAQGALDLKQADKLDAAKKVDADIKRARKPRATAAPAPAAIDPFGVHEDAAAVGGAGGKGQGRDSGASDETTESRFVNGRNFFRNGNAWTDSLCQSLKKDAKRVKIVFNSDEYFDLMAKHPKAIQWFSLGRNVQVVIGKTIYEIVEKTEVKKKKA